ncbi:MAG: prepilin-type N-terminal cleavage/methylation domain-containing protein [Candidatus Pacebacteria bacterium]|nr:prepilin-type N-terminal cleavage/methylation domain-containing protein [Candidatus Paceibacterota bacterium]
MPHKTKNKKFCGFTIIELMVVFAIILILAIYTVAAYSEAFPRFSLERTTEGFVGDVAVLKNRTLGFSGYEEGGEVNKSNYGIFLEEGEEDYIIFIDKNEDKEYQVGEEERVVETEKSLVCLLSESDENDKLSILFTSSDIFLNGAEATTNTEITFCASKNNEIKRKISISPTGVVEVEI